MYSLAAYVEQKGGEEIRGMMEQVPPQLQLQHAVETWQIAAKYLAQPKAQQNQ